jgi:hypothetical protein
MLLKNIFFVFIKTMEYYEHKFSESQYYQDPSTHWRFHRIIREYGPYYVQFKKILINNKYYLVPLYNTSDQGKINNRRTN